MAIDIIKGTPKTYRVYVKRDGEVYYWHLDVRQENKRVWTPHISTQGEILGVAMFSGIILNKEKLFEGDIVYVAGEGNVIVQFPFFDLYERIYTGSQSDIEKILGNIYENPGLIELIHK